MIHFDTPSYQQPLLRIAAVELCSGFDIAANMRRIERVIDDARTDGVHLVVLPENACGMGNQLALAERFDEMVAWYASLAKAHRLFIVAGTLPCPHRPDGSPVAAGKVRQASLMFAPTGACVARYDKMHLFRATVADAVGSYDEGRTFEAGDNPVVAKLSLSLLEDFAGDDRVFGVGMMICFDLRFAAFAQHLRDMGAHILVAPSAFTYKTGQAHWHSLLVARALDTQCLIVGSAQGGTHTLPDGGVRQTWGHSAIVDATTKTLAHYPADTTAQSAEFTNAQPAYVTTAFDDQAQQTHRDNLPIFACRRTL